MNFRFIQSTTSLSIKSCFSLVHLSLTINFAHKFIRSVVAVGAAGTGAVTVIGKKLLAVDMKHSTFLKSRRYSGQNK